MPLKSLLAASLVGAAVGGAVTWAVLSPQTDDLAARIDQLEGDVLDARHAAEEMKAVAEAERVRTESARRQLEELRRLRDAKPPTPRGKQHGTGANGGAEPPPPLPEDPQDWDRATFETALQALARRPRQHRPANPLFQKAMQAVELQGESGTAYLAEAIKAPGRAPIKQLAVALAGALKAEALAEPLRAAYASETNAKVRRGMLGALGKIGDGQPDLMRSVFEKKDGNVDKMARHVAISALARRADPVALRIATGELEDTPQVRARAAEGLYTRVRDGGFEDATLVPVFCKILETADGDAQRGYAIAAVEGLWTKECIPSVKAMLAVEGVNEKLAARARKLLEGLESGAERPDNAGGFERTERKPRQKRSGRALTPPAPTEPGSGGE